MSCQRCNQSGCAGCGTGDCACPCVEPHLGPPTNRAGMDTVQARLGDYRDFFDDAIARLSDPARLRLRDLGTRDLNDPAIAWLDAWAVAADVVTFYRERLT